LSKGKVLLKISIRTIGKIQSMSWPEIRVDVIVEKAVVEHRLTMLS
jgi:hypothetical protein